MTENPLFDRQNSDDREVRRIRCALLQRFEQDEEILAGSSRKRPLPLHALTLHDRRDSSDGATKLLFRTEQGWLLETVLLRFAGGRTTVCVSSQVGCAVGCTFCATGRMPSTKNLTSTEILDQVVQAGQMATGEGRRLRNIVFMGMGEPFHNQQQLEEAVDRLVCPKFFHCPPRRLLVSTVGIPTGMRRFAERFPAVNLALSLHSVNPSVREALIPLAHRFSLDELQSTIAEVNRLQVQPLLVEYLMLADRTDSVTDAQLLCQWLAGLKVDVNLIPYNPIAAAPGLRGSTRQQHHAFAEVLRAAGFPTRIRNSLGGEIAAACGQLVQSADRQPAG